MSYRHHPKSAASIADIEVGYAKAPTFPSAAKKAFAKTHPNPCAYGGAGREEQYKRKLFNLVKSGVIVGKARETVLNDTKNLSWFKKFEEENK